jgi:simple sugar transport system substrate-binding protein
MKRFLYFHLLLLLLLINSCKGGGREEGIEFLIGVSNSSMLEQWRIILNRELQEEADKLDNVSVVFTDAASSVEKQIEDMDRLMGYGMDLLIVSPSDTVRLTPVISRIYKEIPVIILDRVVDGFDYTLFIGPDNENIGCLGARALYEILGDAGGNVLEISTPGELMTSRGRSRGLQRELMDNYSKIHVVKSLYTDSESRMDAKDQAEDLLMAFGETALERIDAVFTHSDGLSHGASRALSRMGFTNIPVVGTDGYQGEDGGLEMLRKGMIHSSIVSSTGGREAMRYAMDILNRKSGVPKQVILKSRIVTKETLDTYYADLNRKIRTVEHPVRLGYAQVGSESQWRISNTKSIVQAAKDFDIELLYRDADQDQETQKAYIREFIAEGVDAILLSPIVEEGYEEVLREAKTAGIPVLLSDRKVESGPEELYVTFIGGDFREEGRRAARWILSEYKDHPADILEIQGTPGATPTVERREGFLDIIDNQNTHEIRDSLTGNYTYKSGFELTRDFLIRSDGQAIDVIFAHNDDMILGAIDAVKEAGLEPGEDIKLVSIDGTKDALTALEKGEMNFVVECTPLLGNQVMRAVMDLMEGKSLPMRIVTDEQSFTRDQVNESLIRSRTY